MIPGIVESSRWVASFSDTFNRTNAANIATPNLEWEEIIGDWQVASNTAYSPTAAASYPLAAINTFRENTSVTSYNGTAGAGFGVAFWVVDSNNWWAVVSDVSSTQSGGTVYSCPNGGSLSGTTCLNTCYSTCYDTCYEQCCTGGSCPGGLSGSCGGGGYAFGCYQPGGCGCPPGTAGDVSTCTCYSDYQGGLSTLCIGSTCGYGCWYGWPFTTSYEFAGGCYGAAASGVVAAGWLAGTVTSTGACNPYSCNPYSCNPYACNYTATATNTTITTYAHSIKLIRKLAGTVSVIATQSFGSEQNTPVYFTSLSVTTVGNVVTYSGLRNGSTNSYSATAVLPTKGTKHGIILSPTTAGAQTTQVDRFDYNA